MIGFLFTSCVAQNNRIEDKIMDCSYQSFADGGKEFRSLLADYEGLLINEGILADNSGKSYRQVLQNIANGKNLDKAPSKFFTDELQKIEKPDLEKAQECQKIIVRDSASYNFSKLEGLEQAFMTSQNSNAIQPSLLAKDILKILSEEDFEIDFYKVRIFFLFNLIEPDSGVNRRLPEIDNNQIEYDLTNALKIFLNDQSEILVNEAKVTLDELKELVRDYELKNKSESIISLKNDRKTKYKNYVEVQNAIVGEIRDLRIQLAKEKYNMDLDSLTEEQLFEIKKIYPQKLVE